MKLHLPKSLRAALFAAFASVVAFSSSAIARDAVMNQGDNKVSQCSYLSYPEYDTVSAIVDSTNRVFNICQDDTNGNTGDVTIHNLVLLSGDTIQFITNPWPNAHTYNDFTNLVVDVLSFGGDSGSGHLVVKENQIAYVKSVSGTLSSVSNAGTLTLGAVTIGGTITNSGTLKLVGTLAGSGSITGGGRVEIDTTGNLACFDGVNYSYSTEKTDGKKAGFLVDEQTINLIGSDIIFDGNVYVNGAEVALSNGEYAYTVDNSANNSIFYIDDTWDYNAEQSEGATSFAVTVSGVLNLPGNATPLGNMNIESDGTVKLTGDTKLSGELVIDGGYFTNGEKKIEKNDREKDGKLVLNNVVAEITGGVQRLDVDLEIGDGAKLIIGIGDAFHWNNKNKLSVLTGGSVELGDKRQTLGGGYIIEMAGGTITGVGDDKEISLDFYKGGTVETTENSILAAHLGNHNSDSQTVEFDVSADKTLTMTGNLVNINVNKTGSGSMVYKGAEFARELSIGEGIFEYYTESDRTHSGNIVGGVEKDGGVLSSGTLSKTGGSKLTLNGKVGTKDVALSSISVKGGQLELFNTSYVGSITMEGGHLTFGGVGKKHTIGAWVDKNGSNDKTLTVSHGALVQVGQFSNDWGSNMVVHGKLNVTGDSGMLLANAKQERLAGSGIIDTSKLVIRNQSVYTVGTNELNIGTGGLSIGASSQRGGIVLSSANTNIAGVTSVTLAESTLTFDAGNATLNGAVTNNGTITINGGVAVLNGAYSGNGTVNVNGGSLVLAGDTAYSISQLNYNGGALSYSDLTVNGSEFSGTLHNAGNLTLKGTLNINTADLRDFATAENSFSDTESGNGFYTGTRYNVITGGSIVYDNVTIQINGTNAAADAYSSVGNMLSFTTNQENSTYYVNNGTVILGGDHATSGAANASLFAVQTGATLQVEALTNGANIRSLLENGVAGTGTLLVNVNGLDTSNGSKYNLTATFGGILELAEKITFTLGDGRDEQFSQDAAINTNALTGLVLNNDSKLQYNANGATNIANVQVKDGAKATIHFKDSDNANQVQLTGKTQLDGELTLSSRWDGGIRIHSLLGDGTLKGGSGTGDFYTTVSSLVHVDGNKVSSFAGSLEFTGGNNIVNVSTGTGTDIELSKLSVSGTKYFMLNVQTDTTVNELKVANGTSAWINIDKDGILKFTKGDGNGTINLTGSGVYDMGSNISSTIVSGLTDADNWQGKVIIRDNQSVTHLNLSALGNANSWVQLKNLKGYWAQGSNSALPISTNLIMGNETGESIDAFIHNNGYSSTVYTISGAVKGTGNLVVDREQSGATVITRFEGDVSGWTGSYKNIHAESTSELTFAGNASTVNAEIKRTNGTLNLTVATDAAASLNKVVTVSNLTLEQGVKFASGGENTVAGALTVAAEAGKNISLTNDSTLSVTGGLTSEYGLTIAGGAGDIILSGAQNTVNGNLSIASGNVLTLAKGSALNVNNAIQNDGSLDIKGTVNWTLSSAAGLTVQYYEEELSKEKTNRLGQGVITGLITGDGSFVNHGDVSATLNNAAVTIHTATGLVTAEGLVYYVMNSPKYTPQDPKGSREGLVYSFGNDQEVLLSDVVHVGNHDKKGGPFPSADVDKAQRFYVGDNGILAIMGNIVDLENPDNIYMTAGDILESVKGTGDIILRTPGYKDTDGSYPTLNITVDSKTHVTGSLYLAPYVLNESSANVEQAGIFLHLNGGADISSFSSVHYGYPYSEIIVNGIIGADAETGAHINDLSAVGCGIVFLGIDKGSNNELILGGTTTIAAYQHGKTALHSGILDVDFHHENSLITIEKLSGTHQGKDDYSSLKLTTGMKANYEGKDVTLIKGVVDIKSFDYKGLITMFPLNESDKLHLNINLKDSQELQDGQVCIITYEQNLDKLAEGTATFTIKGSGTYILGQGHSMSYSSYTMDMEKYNFGVLDENWTGTVEVNRLVATGDVTGISGINPADYGNESSTVHFKGFKGYLTDDTPEEVAIVQNLVLTNALEEKDEYDTTFPAMDAYEISSGVEGQVQNYTGTISGDGDFVVSASGNMTFNLKGNISGWAAEAEETEPPALIVRAGEHAVNFSDNATVINADLLTYTGGTMNAAISNEAAVTVNGVVSHVAGGTLNMTVDTAQGTTFNNTVDINNFKVSSGSVTFNKQVDLDKLEVSSGSIANVAAGASAGKVEIQSRYTKKGAAVLQNGMVIEGSSVTGGSAQNAAFEYAKNGSISNAYLENVSLSSSLQSLQEKSSISMENIVATNVYLAGEANFVSLDAQKEAFHYTKTITAFDKQYNEVAFATNSFNGMMLDASLAGDITLTVAEGVELWERAEADALTNVTITLTGFRVEDMQNGDRVEEWFSPLYILTPEAENGVLLADNGTLTVAELLNPDAYLFKYYEQTANGLIIRMSNIPEPSTATLSLLALAALAARRRRR